MRNISAMRFFREGFSHRALSLFKDMEEINIMRKLLLLSSALLNVLAFQNVYADDFEEYQRKQQRDLQEYQQQQQKGISSQAADYREFVFKTQQEYTRWKENRENELREFASNVESSWGYFREPSNKKWVEYSADSRSVSEVDFEEGRVTVEILADDGENEESVKKRLIAAIERVINSRGSAKSLPLEPTNEKDMARQKPVLSDQIADNRGSTITVDNSHGFAEKTAEKAHLSSTSTGKKKLVATFKLVPDHLEKRMAPYLSAVRKYASIYSLDEALVLATIHTESYFNPLARSSCGAIGLMQLMPDRGGLEAYRYVFDKSGIPSESFLFDAENNIQLGCAYIHILQNQYFIDIAIPQSRLYCGIAGYNTGPANVAKAFNGSRNVQTAIPIINSLKPSDKVYRHMLVKLPYGETRDYLKNVVTRMELYR